MNKKYYFYTYCGFGRDDNDCFLLSCILYNISHNNGTYCYIKPMSDVSHLSVALREKLKINKKTVYSIRFDDYSEYIKVKQNYM